MPASRRSHVYAFGQAFLQPQRHIDPMLRSLGRISRQSAVIDAALRRAASTVAVGDAIPPGIELDAGFPPAKFDLADRLAGKSVVLLGLPGAFTPT